MEIVTNSYMPGDPRLVEQLVYELKSQGIFDQFRKECIADVDTKPAYQNLRQRVEGSVTSFLSQQTWRPDMNKNQVREQLRKNIYESGYLDTGVERIVDQVVNPKINTIFLPQVEDVVYRYLGIEKPNRLEVKKELKIDVTDLLPTDLEAISPESDHTKDDSLNFNDSVNSETKMEEDESPPFEPIDIQRSNVQPEENSVDSHLSGFSGLQSHDSNPCTEPKICPMELSNQDSQVSQNSSESRLSIITSEDNTKMEIREDSDSKLLRSSDSNSQMENPVKMQTTFDSNSIIKDEVMKTVEETDSNSDNNIIDNKNMKKQEEDKEEDATKKKQIDEKQSEDKKYNERKSDEKKSRSSEKYSSKDKKDDKYRKSSSSSSRDKEKSSSKYSSSSSSKDRAKTKDRDKKESKSSSSSSKDKDKVEKDKAKNDKEKDRSEREKDRSEREKDRSEKDRNEKEKDRSEKEKDRSEKDKDKDRKDKYEKDKSEKSKSVKDKERSGKDKDKAKSSSSSSNASSTNKYNTNKEKDKSSSSSKSDSSKKDKEKSRSSTSSSSTSKDKSKSSHSDSKYKSSSDKYKRDDKNVHDKHSSSSTSSKKDRDKKKDSKKDVKDDHYSSKDKKNDRRSTDRDSNDGRSGRQGQVNSLSESYVSQPQKSNQESSNSNSGSGSGDSGASDQNEHTIKSKTVEHGDNKELATPCLDTQKFKYIKPKFASNFQEARKLMKIRKQLAKLERHNQLSLAQIEVPLEAPMVNGINCVEKEDINDTAKDKPVENIDKVCEEPKTEEIAECKMSPKDNSLLLQSKELSKENWEALEARLAQEMSNINYNSYESPYDDYDYSVCNSVSVSPKKSPPSTREESNKVENVNKIMESESNKPKAQISKVVCIVLPQIDIRTKLEEKTISVTEEVEKNRIENAVPMATEDNTKEEIEDNKKCLEKEKTDTQEDVMDDKVASNDDSGHINKMQSTENLEIDTHLTKMDVNSENKADNAENTHYSDSESIEPCIYLEPLSPRLDKNLQFLYKYIEKLEQDVKHSLRTFQNNFVPLKEKYGKRKLAENVDVKNNNKAHYEQTTDLKKRRRSVAPNPNSVISKANKEKLCNSSDISPNDSFSLPLSPAESDKSNEKKEEESPKSKQKRAMTGRSMNTRNQRYSSEDLYKPRPIFMSSRRSRGAKNLE